MSCRAHWITGAVLIALSLAACAGMFQDPTVAAPPHSGAPNARSVRVEKNPEAHASGRFHPQLLEIARTYQDYGRVDDESRWAPTDCRMPMRSVARFSESGDEASHGQKLYFVFAKNPLAYQSMVGAKPQAVGQVVVKESWLPKQVDPSQSPAIVRDSVPAEPGSKPKGRIVEQRSYIPYASKDGKVFRAHEKSGLYIMMKVDPALTDTDAGWVYGTVTADGRTVTSAGQVASCMECHASAPHDRLYGIPPKTGKRPPVTPAQNASANPTNK